LFDWIIGQTGHSPFVPAGDVTSVARLLALEGFFDRVTGGQGTFFLREFIFSNLSVW
jgi:hypothetical protein